MSTFCLLYSWLPFRILRSFARSRNQSSLFPRIYLNMWRRRSLTITGENCRIPFHRKGISWFFNCHQIWSLNPTILNFGLFGDSSRLQEIIWIFIKISEHQLTWQTLNNWNYFYYCQKRKYFFYFKNIFSMKIIWSWNNGNCKILTSKIFSQQLKPVFSA